MNKTLTEIFKIVSDNNDIVKFNNPIPIKHEPKVSYNTGDETVYEIDSKILSIELDSFTGGDGEKEIISLEVEFGDTPDNNLRFDYFIKENCTDIYYEGLLNGEMERTNETLSRNLPIKIWRQVLNQLKLN